jgi:VanZ family protein
MLQVYVFCFISVAMGGWPTLGSLVYVFSAQFSNQNYALRGNVVLFFCMFYSSILDKWQLWFPTKALLPRLNRQNRQM